MKKALVVMLVAALSLSMLALAGCGEKESADKAKAQEYMFAGDGYYDAFIENWETLSGSQMDTVMKALGGDTSVVSGEAGQKLAEEAEALMAEMEDNLSLAREQFESIGELSGVEDYAAYADLMLEAIASWEKALEASLALKPVLQTALNDLVAGKITGQDIQKMLLEGEEYKAITEAQEAAEEKADEARDLQEEKELAK